MKAKNLAFSASLVLLAANAIGQSASGSDAEKYARQRAQSYSAALGLDENTTAKLTSVYAEAEAQVAPLRAQCNTIKAKVEETLAPFDKKAEALLTEEQRAKLAELRAAGAWTPGDMCCSSAAAEKTGCAGHGKAAAGAAGCCAGKADAHGHSDAPAHH